MPASNYKRGDKVAIINSTAGGQFLVESHAATIVRPFGDGYYVVNIDGDEVLRYVDKYAQADPDAFVKTLNGQAAIAASA